MVAAPPPGSGATPTCAAGPVGGRAFIPEMKKYAAVPALPRATTSETSATANFVRIELTELSEHDAVAAQGCAFSELSWLNPVRPKTASLANPSTATPPSIHAEVGMWRAVPAPDS